MCYLGRSGIRSDNSKAYYCEVENFSNLSYMHLGLGGAYGHKFANIYFDGYI